MMEQVLTKEHVARQLKERFAARYGERLVKLVRLPRSLYEGAAERRLIYVVAVLDDPPLDASERDAFHRLVTGFLVEESGPYYVRAWPMSRSDYERGRDAAALMTREEGAEVR